MNTHDLAFKAANGMLSFDAEGEWRLNQKEVERFAHLVRAHALEEAAKVCDARATKNELACHDADEDEATSLRSAAWQISVCASAIRALKGQP